jgi:RNA polymerase sigma factor (sigma-70 family)
MHQNKTSDIIHGIWLIPIFPMNETERLVNECKEGNSEALATLYNTYHDLMLKTSLSIVHNEDAAKDILHDGFIIIMTSIGQLKDPRWLQSWIRRIIINLSLKYIQNNQFTQEIDSLENLSNAGTPKDNEIPPLDELMKMIENLPQGYRNVFRLSALEGMSHAEIADELGIAVPTVSSQFYHARILLSKMVKRYRMQMLLILGFISLAPLTYLLLDKLGMKEARMTQTAQENSRARYKNRHVKPSDNQAVRQTQLPSANSSLTPKNVSSGYLPSEIPETSATSATSASSTDVACETMPMTPTLPSAQTVNQTDRDIANFSTDTLTLPTEYKLDTERPWNVDLGEALGNTGNSILNSILSMTAAEDATDTGEKPLYHDFKTWENLNQFCNQHTPTETNLDEWNALKQISAHNTGDIITRKQFGKPLTFGLSISKRLGHHWSIASGIRATRLTTHLQTGDNDDYHISEHQKLWFIGIPLNFHYTLINANRWRIYTTLGGGLDLPIYAHTEKYDVIAGEHLNYSQGTLSTAQWQWSLDAGIGAGYEILPHLELFISPKVIYYIPNHSSTPTLWQNSPWQISYPFGIRVKF